MKLLGALALCSTLLFSARDGHAADPPSDAPPPFLGDAPAEPAPKAADAAPEASSDAAPGTAGKPASDWCGPGIEALAADVCYVAGPNKDVSRRTLVIFLHGLTDEGSGWQHKMITGLGRAGKAHDFSLLFPRGRTGIGPGKKEKQIAWPTGESARKALEDEVIAEWTAARAEIEKRDGKPFDEVFVMGFSNGAYYASSLALRGKLDVDGYGVFAGGSAPKGTTTSAALVKRRRPVFVGVASKDETAKKGRELVKALKSLGWTHKSDTRPVGHVVADGQLGRALEFLRDERDKSRKAATKVSKGSKSDPKKSDKSKAKSAKAKTAKAKTGKAKAGKKQR